MSYMKREWERLEEEKADKLDWKLAELRVVKGLISKESFEYCCDQMGVDSALFRLPDLETEEEFKIRRDWTVKKTFNHDPGTVEIESCQPKFFIPENAQADKMRTKWMKFQDAYRMAAQSPMFKGHYTRSTDHVSDFMQDFGLRKKAVLRCPDCNNMGWTFAVFKDDPVVTCGDSVGRALVTCTNPVMGTTNCHCRSQLYDFMDACDRSQLYSETERWMKQKGLVAVAPPANSFPSLHSVSKTTFKEYVVFLAYSGRQFECRVVMALKGGQVDHPQTEVTVCAKNAFLGIIRDHVDHGTNMPTNVREVYKQFKSAVTPPKPIGQVIKQQMAAMRKSMDENALRNLGYSDEHIKDLLEVTGTHEDPPANDPNVLETDKPEGERDVDKFLKEQQDKLWRSM